MKRTIRFIIVVLLLSQAVQAQENISIGPIAGVSIANLRGENTGTSWTTGLTLGGFLNYSANSGFGVSGQVLYTQLGGKDNDNSREINLNYIQIPILATYFLGKYGQRVRPKLFLGPHINFLLSAKNEQGVDINQVQGRPGRSNAFESIDAGLTAGVGLNVRLANKIWLNTDVRYGLGLLGLLADDQPDIRKIHNHNFGVNVGVSFPLAKYNAKTGRITDR